MSTLLRRIHQHKTCFFLCDIQEKFRPAVANFPQVLNTASKMIKASQIFQIPLIVTEHYSKALGKTCQELNIANALAVVEKTKFSMVVPDVEGLVSRFDAVVLFGIESHVCILQTALDLRRLNKQVFVVVDGISSINTPEIAIAIQSMRDAGCFLTTSESVLFEILGDATNPAFKEISKLIKETRQTSQEALSKMPCSL